MKDGKGFCKDMGPEQKLHMVYGVLILVFAFFSGGFGWAQWLLYLLGVSLIVDAMTCKCPMANFIRSKCGGKSCCDKGSCDAGDKEEA